MLLVLVVPEASIIDETGTSEGLDTMNILGSPEGLAEGLSDRGREGDPEMVAEGESEAFVEGDPEGSTKED